MCCWLKMIDKTNIPSNYLNKSLGSHLCWFPNIRLVFTQLRRCRTWWLSKYFAHPIRITDEKCNIMSSITYRNQMLSNYPKCLQFAGARGRRNHLSRLENGDRCWLNLCLPQTIGHCLIHKGNPCHKNDCFCTAVKLSNRIFPWRYVSLLVKMRLTSPGGCEDT